MNPETSEFWRLFDRYVGIFRDPNNLGRESHDALADILIHLKAHSDRRADFVLCFIALIEGLKDDDSKAVYGWKVLPFCMRELQWVEVKETIDRELGKIDDPEVTHWLKRIRSAFEPFWVDETMFLYYVEKAKKEGRNLPDHP